MNFLKAACNRQSCDIFSLICSAGDNEDENRSAVRKALRRAETRPKNLAKSMEDITGSLSPSKSFLNSLTVMPTHRDGECDLF